MAFLKELLSTRLASQRVFVTFRIYQLKSLNFNQMSNIDATIY